MTEQEMREAQERADLIVKKVKDLVALEDSTLIAQPAEQATFVSQLRERAEELNGIADELKWATPCFRAYVLPQIGEILNTRETFNEVERLDLERIVSTLTDEENAEASEQLTSLLITSLRENLEKTFGS